MYSAATHTSTKQPCRIERDPIAHDVVAGARKFVRERLHGEDRVSLGGFLFVKPPRGRQKLDRKMCCLEERPGQIRITVLGIAFALLLFVADPLAVHAASVGGEVSDVVEALQIAAFKKDGPGNDLANAADRQERLIVRSGFEGFQHCALNAFDLGTEHIDGGTVGLETKLVAGIGQTRPGSFLLAHDHFGRRRDPGMAPQCALGAQYMGCALAHETAPHAQQIAHGAFCLGVNVAAGQNAEAHLLSKPKGIVSIVGVFQSFVLARLGGVHQFEAVAGFHQSVDEPIPVERALYRNGGDLPPIGLERFQRRGKIVRQSLLKDASIIVVDQREVMIV